MYNIENLGMSYRPGDNGYYHRSNKPNRLSKEGDNGYYHRSNKPNRLISKEGDEPRR